MIQKELLKLPVEDLVPYENNPRVISPEAVNACAESMRPQERQGRPDCPVRHCIQWRCSRRRTVHRVRLPFPSERCMRRSWRGHFSFAWCCAV